MKVDTTMGSGAVAERYVVALTCFLTLVIGYCDRVNMALAAPQVMQQKNWSAVQMSWVLSGFFLGHALFLAPSGMLVERVGRQAFYVGA
jgi:MFS transporter, ACS family, D-galactonate transporter